MSGEEWDPKDYWQLPAEKRAEIDSALVKLVGKTWPEIQREELRYNSNWQPCEVCGGTVGSSEDVFHLARPGSRAAQLGYEYERLDGPCRDKAAVGDAT